MRKIFINITKYRNLSIIDHGKILYVSIMVYIQIIIYIDLSQSIISIVIFRYILKLAQYFF